MQETSSDSVTAPAPDYKELSGRVTAAKSAAQAIRVFLSPVLEVIDDERKRAAAVADEMWRKGVYPQRQESVTAELTPSMAAMLRPMLEALLDSLPKESGGEGSTNETLGPPQTATVPLPEHGTVIEPLYLVEEIL